MPVKSAQKQASKPRKSKKEIEAEVVGNILQLLDSGELPPWDRGWSSTKFGLPMNAVSQAPYRGINRWNTMITQACKGYDDNRYLTFKQAQDLGGNVRKGEQGTIIVFWKQLVVEDTVEPEDGQMVDLEQETKPRNIPLLKHHHVFNLEQTDGCKIGPLEPPDLQEHSPLERADDILSKMPNPPEIETYTHNNTPARYQPGEDRIKIPDMGRYPTPEAWYSTLFHELTHSTGHTRRLGRLQPGHTENLHAYGREELVAGMGAAMLCALAGIEHQTAVNNAAYIKAWRDTIAADHGIVIKAASLAQASTDHITGHGDPQ